MQHEKKKRKCPVECLIELLPEETPDKNTCPSLIQDTICLKKVKVNLICSFKFC